MSKTVRKSLIKLFELCIEASCKSKKYNFNLTYGVSYYSLYVFRKSDNEIEDRDSSMTINLKNFKHTRRKIIRMMEE